MSKIKLTGDTSGYVEISAPNVAANNTLELGGGTKILTNLDNVFTGVTTYSGNIDLNANLELDDNNKILFGTGDDLQIYHDGSNSYIDDTGTGALYVRGNYLAFAASNGEQLINAEQNAAVELFHDGTKKLETTATGATVTGTLVSGSVTSELDLTAISSSISDTAVDVFVYDTRKDSDGGAWRKRTQHTSWYNETLNTATRGSRKEFPAVAVIVTTATNVTIYDGDDPDLPMWMNFQSGSYYFIGPGNRVKNSAHMLNGILCVTKTGSISWMSYISFVDDKARQYSDNDGEKRDYLVPISYRNANNANSVVNSIQEYTIVDDATNDVAMTVLPNAPIDDATGLPVPTIAIATQGGVSVIKDDGSVVSKTTTELYSATLSSTYYHKNIDISGENAIVNYEYAGGGGHGQLTVVTLNDLTVLRRYGRDYANTTSSHPYFQPLGSRHRHFPKQIYKNNYIFTREQNDSAINGDADGILTIYEDQTTPSNGLINRISSSYNTGWMHGDIKGAFLSDTDTTNVTASSAHYTETFTGSGDNTWGLAGSATISGGVLTLADAADSRATDLTAASSLTTGQKYIAEIEIVTNTSQIFQLDDDGSGAGQGSVTSYGSCASGKTGTFLIAFTKTGSPRMRFLRLSGGPATITSFKIYTAEEQDRSVNNNGLKVFGTVTKSAVATGAELVGYGPFDNSSYLRQPYNSDLQWDGNSTWSISFWVYFTQNQAYDTVISREQSGGSGVRWSIQTGNQNTLTFKSQGSSRVDVPGDGVHSRWRHICFTQEGGMYRSYRDGVEVGTYVGSDNFSNTSAELNIGYEAAIGGAEQSKLALVRISNSFPSPEQIKKIYEDEKVLFQENAKCTLYGSSDAVTALGYDEDTELLHVGTSAGRSDFQGLRRINNTTTAVTTAISASDDLIAEQ